MSEYKNLTSKIRDLLRKSTKDATATYSPNLPAKVTIVDPDPIELPDDERSIKDLPDNDRQLPIPKDHQQVCSTDPNERIKHHLIRNIKAQQKLKIIDNP